MLNAIGFCIKVLVFSSIVLVLGNWIHWDGKTISDQVKLQMAHSEPAHLVGNVRNWAEKLTQDARQGIQRKIEQHRSSDSEEEEDISPSERQKLKALIKELNGSHKK